MKRFYAAVRAASQSGPAAGVPLEYGYDAADHAAAARRRRKAHIPQPGGLEELFVSHPQGK